MIEELYIAKEGGLVFFATGKMANRDLIVPFCEAMNAFSKENMNARIKLVQLESGKCLHFKEVLPGIKVVIIATASTTQQSVNSTFIKVKWELEKGSSREAYTTSPLAECKDPGFAARIDRIIKE